MAKTDSRTRFTDEGGARLGTFAGVFTPSILTILGIILFLRLGYVVGGAGLEEALLVIAAANVISVLTALSVSAISTNLKVKGGGDYYLISRTLGISFGGAIGLVLFLAQAVSVGFYTIGFAEASAALLGYETTFATQLLAAGAVLGLFVLAWLGADWATRFQYVVMAGIAAAIADFAWGGFTGWDSQTFAANLARPGDGLPFWIAFAIFFPAVTGFTQGVSMSGDLASPAKSIPRGVISAVVLSMFVYVGCAVLFAGAQEGSVMRTDYMAMKNVAAFAPLIDFGVIAATLSSALASFLGAPRILQSLASDEVFPALQKFAEGHGPAKNPRRAVVLAGLIALAVVALGDLNAVAAVVSMFFLISYGLLNYATFVEARAKSPSFRPTFRFFHPWASLAGALVCLGAMLAIDLWAGAAAVAVVFAIYQYVERREIPARWADGRRSHHLHEARRHLIAAQGEPERARDWRPQLLVFSDAAERRARLLRFASWIEGGSGLTTVVRILEGHGPEMLAKREEALEDLKAQIKEEKFKAFPLVVTARDMDQAVSSVIQSAGVGPVRVNTVVANWIGPVSPLKSLLGTNRFTRNLRTAFRLGCNLVILDAETHEWESLGMTEAEKRVIDVWWRPNKTGELMLLLAHLVRRSSEWEGAKIRVLAEPQGGETPDLLKERLQARLDEFRIEAEIAVSGFESEEIVANSRGASLVFMPFAIHGGRVYAPSGAEVDKLLKGLPVVILTLAAQDVDLGADTDEEAHEEKEKEEAGEKAEEKARAGEGEELAEEAGVPNVPHEGEEDGG